MNYLVALTVLLLLSAIFSGSETALISISKARAESLVKKGRHGAKALLKLKNDTSRMLITILIGNNLVNIAAASIATVVATSWFGQLGPGIAVGVLTVLILVFGEITPKSLATRYSERISLFISPFILVMMRILYPIVWVFNHFTTWVHSLSGIDNDPIVTESELIQMADHGEQEGTIESSERELIERVFAFSDLTVADVMTPRSQVFSLEGSRTVADVLSEVLEESYSRMPIYLDEPDEIQSVLYLRDLLEAMANQNTDVQLKDIAHEPVYVSEYQPIDELIATLRREMRHMAIVVDEYGAIRGVVTLEDLMEELVGEIYDESDNAPTDILKINENEIRVAGTVEARIIEEHFDIDLPGKPTDTISYWVLGHTERIPKSGEEFNIDGLGVTVNKASKRSIDQVSLVRLSEIGKDETDAEINLKEEAGTQA